MRERKNENEKKSPLLLLRVFNAQQIYMYGRVCRPANNVLLGGPVTKDSCIIVRLKTPRVVSVQRFAYANRLDILASVYTHRTDRLWTEL